MNEEERKRQEAILKGCFITFAIMLSVSILIFIGMVMEANGL